MKPQSLKLLEHLNNGGEVTRQSGFLEFGIQNLTARISELRGLGYKFTKTRIRLRSPLGLRRIWATAWRLAECLRVGDRVLVIKDSGTLISLKGRIGVIHRLELEDAQVVIFIPGVGFRQMPFTSLQRLQTQPTGAPVTLVETSLVVGEYHPEVDSYTLLTSDPAHTLVASAPLVRPKQTSF